MSALESSRLRAPGIAQSALALALGLLAATALPARDVPFLSGRIVDEATLLSNAERSDIEAQLQALEQRRGAQMAVLLVASLQGDSLEDFSIRVVDTWKLGDQDRDDGVLLLISTGDRRLRLEVGYGLEPVLTDAMSGRILDHVLAPAFRRGDYAGGISAAIDSVGALLGGEGVPPSSPPSSQSSLGCVGLLILLFLFLVVLPMLTRRRRRGGRAWSSSGGWYLPSSSGWGGGSSGGGFSGGGGSFGGGGASGGW